MTNTELLAELRDRLEPHSYKKLNIPAQDDLYFPECSFDGAWNERISFVEWE